MTSSLRRGKTQPRAVTWQTKGPDVFEVQEDIAQAIVGALRGQLDLGAEAPSLVRPGTDDLEAYNAYLATAEDVRADEENECE